MILCCKKCGSYYESDFRWKACDYCGGKPEVLFSDAEVQAIDKYELKDIIKSSRERYKAGNNEEYDERLWRNREEKEQFDDEREIWSRTSSHMVTTGYEFDGYTVVRYRGVMSGQVVLGTGFLSEFTASFSDFFGTQASKFSDKLEQAKDAAMKQLIRASAEKGGNAIIGVDFDYITFSNNMIGVVANGTSVTIEKKEDVLN